MRPCRVVAEDIYAPIDAPSFDRATRDGFAVRFTDIVGAKEDKICYQFIVLRPAKSAMRPIA